MRPQRTCVQWGPEGALRPAGVSGGRLHPPAWPPEEDTHGGHPATPRGPAGETDSGLMVPFTTLGRQLPPPGFSGPRRHPAAAAATPLPIPSVASGVMCGALPFHLLCPAWGTQTTAVGICSAFEEAREKSAPKWPTSPRIARHTIPTSSRLAASHRRTSGQTPPLKAQFLH